MMILNQSGTTMFNTENIVSVGVKGSLIKIMLPIALEEGMKNEKEQRLPQIVIAKYGSPEKAEREFDRFIARLNLVSGGVWQFPKEDNGEAKCESD